jgi:hypothetical protein
MRKKRYKINLGTKVQLLIGMSHRVRIFRDGAQLSDLRRLLDVKSECTVLPREKGEERFNTDTSPKTRDGAVQGRSEGFESESKCRGKESPIAYKSSHRVSYQGLLGNVLEVET